MNRIFVPCDKVRKELHTLCIEKITLDIDEYFPERLYICFTWELGILEYLTFDIYKEYNGTALYKSTRSAQRLLVSEKFKIFKEK